MALPQWSWKGFCERAATGMSKPPPLPSRRVVATFGVGVVFIPFVMWGVWLWVVCSAAGFASAAAAFAPPVSKQQIQEHVAKISQDFYPRSYEDRENLERCAQYIAEFFRVAGGQVSFQEYRVENLAYKNVLAIFPGKDARRIVVGAHYDACGSTPGADDNASGVAGLLELARLLKGAPLKHTVELAAYCTEEPPYFDTEDMGSMHHAKALRAAKVDVLLMIALEMIGYFSDTPGSQDYPVSALGLVYPTTGNFIGVLGIPEHLIQTGAVTGAMRGATDLPVYGIAIPAAVPGTLLSDHLSYIEQGYPALMVSDLAFYRNKAYHEPEDTSDRLDYARMAKVVDGVYQAVLALDRS